MANPIVMPRLGDFMTEGTISKWNKAAGDGVAQGEVICEIEAEKLNYQLEAGGAGVLHTVAGEGDVVPVDGIIAYLLAEGEAPPAAETSAPAAADDAPAAEADEAAPVAVADEAATAPAADDAAPAEAPAAAEEAEAPAAAEEAETPAAAPAE